MEPTLKKLRVVVTHTTTTDTSTIHGACTDLREAVTYLRKLADEIATAMRRAQRATHNPSSEPDAPATSRPAPSSHSHEPGPWTITLFSVNHENN